MDLGHILKMELSTDIYAWSHVLAWQKKVAPFTEIGKTALGRHSGIFNEHISLRCSLETQDVC